MYLFIVAGLCFLLFLAKLRSRLLAAEAGAGELTSLVVASGAVFVAIMFVAAASRGVIGFAVKSPGDNSRCRTDTLRYLPQTVCRARHRRPARSRRRDGASVMADRADGSVRPLAGMARGDRARDRRAAAALMGMVAIPAMLIWVVAVSVAMWRGPR